MWCHLEGLLSHRADYANGLMGKVTMNQVAYAISGMSSVFCMVDCYSEGAKAVAAPRPDRLVNRLKSINLDDANAPRLTVLRQPRGPDNSKVCMMKGQLAE